MVLLTLPPLQLPTGVPGLDEVLGGGIPEGSCTAIVGGPGTGKSTLAQQMLFTCAAAGRTGVYFAGPGEPPDKLLRHQQQLSFFVRDQLDQRVFVANLTQNVVEGDPNDVLARIADEVQRRRASFIVIDLVQALTPPRLWNDLAFYLSAAPFTSLLIADTDPLGTPPNAVLGTTDSVIWLRQTLESEISLRTVEAPKVRGQQPLPGLHSARLTWDGMQVYPRWPLGEPRVVRGRPPRRLSVGVDELDVMLGGGLPEGDAILVDGPSGTGKSFLGAQFITANAARGEPGAVLLFEERPDRFVDRAEAVNLPMERLVDARRLEVRSLRGRDLTADEIIHEVLLTVRRIGARSVVIDSLGGLEFVLRGRDAMRDCLWRLLDMLTGAGITVWLANGPDIDRSLVSHMVDDILELRTDRQLTVLKMRSSSHTQEARPYEIGASGLQMVQREYSKRRNGHVAIVKAPAM